MSCDRTIRWCETYIVFVVRHVGNLVGSRRGVEEVQGKVTGALSVRLTLRDNASLFGDGWCDHRLARATTTEIVSLSLTFLTAFSSFTYDPSQRRRLQLPRFPPTSHQKSDTRIHAEYSPVFRSDGDGRTIELEGHVLGNIPSMSSCYNGAYTFTFFIRCERTLFPNLFCYMYIFNHPLLS